MTDKLKGDWLTRLFYLLYVAISVATFRHTALGFASIESGSPVWGALSALAIDAGMVLSASGLRRGRSWPLVLGLVVSAGASTFGQLLFSVAHAQPVTVAPGAAWMGDWAAAIIDARVLILPALLPLLSVVYAFAAKGERVAVSDKDTRLAEILASNATKTEKARRVLGLSDNGEFNTNDVAALVGCHPGTVRNAKPKPPNHKKS